MKDNSQLFSFDEGNRLKEFYEELQRDILDTAYDRKDREVKKSDIWKIVIQEGLYQNLVENTSVALGFFLTTSHGPEYSYNEYLDLANGYNDIVVLVALSALVNDISHRENHYLNDETMPNRLNSKEYPPGDMAELSQTNKQTRASELLSAIDCPITESELVTDSKLYDYPIIYYLYTGENIRFLFKSQSYGYLTGEMETSVDPGDDGCSYTIITDRRVLVIVGKGHFSDRILSIPILSITDVKVDIGWTKDKIELRTKNQDYAGPYQIWVPNLSKNYNKSNIVEYLKL